MDHWHEDRAGSYLSLIDEMPEIIALPVIGGNEDYLRWIDSEIQR